jgi:hypothetical protein
MGGIQIEKGEEDGGEKLTKTDRGRPRGRRGRRSKGSGGKTTMIPLFLCAFPHRGPDPD